MRTSSFDYQQPAEAGDAAEVAEEAVVEDQPNNEPVEQHPQRVAEPVQPENHDGLAAAHQALLQREGPMGFQPYKRPKMFPFLVRITTIVSKFRNFKSNNILVKFLKRRFIY